MVEQASINAKPNKTNGENDLAIVIVLDFSGLNLQTTKVPPMCSIHVSTVIRWNCYNGRRALFPFRIAVAGREPGRTLYGKAKMDV